MKLFLASILLFLPSFLLANTRMVPSTTFSMPCYIISQDDNWTYRDFGFTLTYIDSQGKKRVLSAKTDHAPKNCATPYVTLTAQIPPGVLEFHIADFSGEAGSTIECTNTIHYALSEAQVGKNCEFIVKTPKYGSFTTTAECAIQVNCNPSINNTRNNL